MSATPDAPDQFINGIITIAAVFALITGLVMSISPRLSKHLLYRAGTKEAWQMEQSLWSNSRRRYYRITGFALFLFGLLILIAEGRHNYGGTL